VFGTWRVHVTFASPAGRYYGQPIKRASTFTWMIHVVGSGERPFSSMTPDEIEALYQEQALAFRDTNKRRSG
jgi:hypothetical protein